jgi:hypothetical protein
MKFTFLETVLSITSNEISQEITLTDVLTPSSPSQLKKVPFRQNDMINLLDELGATASNSSKYK